MSLKSRFYLLFLLAGITFSCSKKNTTQNVQNNCVYTNAPSAQVNFAILAGSAQFFPLNVTGGYIYVSGYGYQSRGILIYRVNQTQFVAFDRNCTKDGCTNTKAIVWVPTTNTTICKDSVCGSIYNIFDGSVQQGPAVVPLYQYHTNWDGNQLHVYN
jgi:Rieske Fe-S protein